MSTFIPTPEFRAQFRDISLADYLQDHREREFAASPDSGFSHRLRILRGKLVESNYYHGAFQFNEPVGYAVADLPHTPLGEWLASWRSIWKAEVVVAWDASVLNLVPA